MENILIRKTTATVIALALTVSGSLALAHEGHGQTGQGNSATHYLSEPFHLFQFFAIGVAVFAVGWMGLKWLVLPRLQGK
jgi:hydrogenase/urease accessory protein HupE